MNSRHPSNAGAHTGDEVARRRRFRPELLLDRPVAEFEDLTLREVLTSVVAAAEQSEEPLDVERFLTESGHAWQTVDVVIASLDLVEGPASSPRAGP